MTKSELLMQLRELNEELALINERLATEDRVDDETIDALGQFVTDIGELVDQTSEKLVDEEPMKEQHQGIADRIEQFESEHPQVTNFLNRLADMLGMMGI